MVFIPSSLNITSVFIVVIYGGLLVVLHVLRRRFRLRYSSNGIGETDRNINPHEETNENGIKGESHN